MKIYRNSIVLWYVSSYILSIFATEYKHIFCQAQLLYIYSNFFKMNLKKHISQCNISVRLDIIKNYNTKTDITYSYISFPSGIYSSISPGWQSNKVHTLFNASCASILFSLICCNCDSLNIFSFLILYVLYPLFFSACIISILYFIKKTPSFHHI